MIDENWKSARQARSFQRKQSAIGAQAALVSVTLLLLHRVEVELPSGHPRGNISVSTPWYNFYSPAAGITSTHLSLSHVDPLVLLWFLSQAASFIPPAFTSGAIQLLRSPARFLLLEVLGPFFCTLFFFFKQFLNGRWKKDLGGGVGTEVGEGDACRTWHGESKALFLRLFQWGIRLCIGTRYDLKAAPQRGLSCNGEA